MKQTSTPTCGNNIICNVVQIRLKRAYEQPEETDGLRILVDRLWPRGLSKKRLQLDGWEKNLAPSRALRVWFAHEPDRWEEFRPLYLEELDKKYDVARALLSRAGTSPVTLIYAARDERYNHALVLKEFLEKIQ